LITSAEDFVNAMGWQNDVQLQQAQAEGIERSIFPELSDDEQKIARILEEFGDFQLNQLSVKTNIPIGQLTALLFQMEMKGVIRPLAGGTYHLLL
jgi:DNA processing protein